MTSDTAPFDTSDDTSAADWHAHRVRTLETNAAQARRRSTQVANLRFALFVAFLGVLAVSEARAAGDLGVWLASLPLVGFIVAILLHQRIRQRQAHHEAGCAVHREAIRRVSRSWHEITPPPMTAPDDHPYAHDLDVTGHASLAHLLSAVRTPAGRSVLRSWLLDGADRNTIVGRQLAVTDLTPRRVMREAVEVSGRLYVRPAAGSLSDLRKWLDEPAWLAPRRGLLWFGRMSTGATVVLAIAHLAGVIPYALWLIPIILNFVLSRRLMNDIHPIFDRATAGEGAFVAYEKVLQLFSAERFTAPRLIELQTHVRGDNWSAPDVIARFRRMVSLVEVRRSFVGAILQGLMLWDVWVLHRLENWRARWSSVAETWFDVAAEVEVLTAFGGLHEDNPRWCLPTIPEYGDRLMAKDLGHPLLANAVRVANDLTIGPPGTFVFVTGSNMSGKSTLLRAAGCNVVLAQAGAPVCCGSLTLPIVRLRTNMRISDSLAAGESYYLAALRRLKLVIDAARRAAPPGPPVLYLLDEILQGTNSAERKIAVQGVISELLQSHAIGAITSHDLSLIDRADLESVAQSVHFTENVTNEASDAVMTFDYKLRPGIAPTRNALRLMEIIGLRAMKQ